MANYRKIMGHGDSFHIKEITTTTGQIFSWISLGFLVIAMADRNFEWFFCHQKLFENVGIGWRFCLKKNDWANNRNHERSLSTEPDASDVGLEFYPPENLTGFFSPKRHFWIHDFYFALGGNMLENPGE